jgi:hypothetical protein
MNELLKVSRKGGLEKEVGSHGGREKSQLTKRLDSGGSFIDMIGNVDLL